jgi:hypothetical protein
MIACSAHSRIEANFYCSTHDIFMCHSCAWDDHIDHPKEARSFDFEKLKVCMDYVKPKLLETRERLDKCIEVAE